jgi:homoserine kinase
MASPKVTNRLTFKATAATVSIPATSANMGPGFDSFGLALDLRDRYIAQILDEQIIDIDIAGEGATEVKKDKNNLVYKSMHRAFEVMGQQPRGIALRQLNAIPHGRGLGSSSAAIVGGMILARSLVLDGEMLLPDELVFALASEIEGHPDNVAPTIYGGVTIAWMGESGAEKISLTVNPQIRVLIFIPQGQLATAKARKMLPESISREDAIKNSINSALMSTAISTRPDLLFKATEDFLHQSYRKEGYPHSYALVEELRASGHAAFISGAGPAVAILHTLGEEELSEIKSNVAQSFGEKFSPIDSAIATRGALLEK